MTLLPRGVKVHLAFGFIDMRKGIDGLAMLSRVSCASAMPPTSSAITSASSSPGSRFCCACR